MTKAVLPKCAHRYVQLYCEVCGKYIATVCEKCRDHFIEDLVACHCEETEEWYGTGDDEEGALA